MPNPQHTLRTSMTAQVSIVLGNAQNALTIPRAALGRRIADNRYEVRVLMPDNLPQTREIHVGLMNDTIAQIAMITHRLRTLLTMLGIIIGITAVITVVALGQGAQRSVITAIEAIGTNTVSLNPGRNWGDERASSIHTLVGGDVAALRAQFYVDSVSPTVSSTQTLLNGNVKATASVSGVGEDYFRVHGTGFAEGQRFDDAQVRRRAQVVVIDDNTRQQLFKSWEQPIGKVILVGALPCTVIGVTVRSDGLFGPRSDLIVYLPYTTVADRLTGQSWLNSITVRIRDGVPNKLAERSMTKLVADRHRAQDFFTSSSVATNGLASNATMQSKP